MAPGLLLAGQHISNSARHRPRILSNQKLNRDHGAQRMAMAQGEKVIGVLGGMGPEATLTCFARIIQNTLAEKDQDHLRVIIDSNAKVPDRTEAILGKGPSPVPVLVQSAAGLAQAGADFIIIPCVS